MSPSAFFNAVALTSVFYSIGMGSPAIALTSMLPGVIVFVFIALAIRDMEGSLLYGLCIAMGVNQIMRGVIAYA